MRLFRNVRKLYKKFRSRTRRVSSRPVAPVQMYDQDAPVQIKYTVRDGNTERLNLTPDWERKGNGYECCELWVPKDGINLLVHFERFDGFDAVRLTVSLVNSVKDAGPFYFYNFWVSIQGINLTFAAGKDVVLPGGIFVNRWSLGYDGLKLKEFDHKEFPKEEEWINDKCAAGMATFPSTKVGPYSLGFNSTKGDSSLNGSHGGFAIGPFQGGPNCWTKENPKAWQYKEMEMLAVASRSPIAKTDTLGNFIVDPQPGWPGRTWLHEKDGWKYSPTLLDPKFENQSAQGNNGESYLVDSDGNFLTDTVVVNGQTQTHKKPISNFWFWCSYEAELFKYRAIDHTHLHRQTRAAAMIAEQDAFARWFLRASWNDLANWLGSEGGSNNKSLWNLTEKLTGALEGKGADWGGRGWAHTIRCFLYAEPYLTEEEKKTPESLRTIHPEWFNALRYATSYIATVNGICHSFFGDHFPGLKDKWVARGREVDLMGPNFIPLGLPQLDNAWKDHCSPYGNYSLANSFEVTDKKHWTDGAWFGADYFPGYDGIRGLYTEFGSAKETEVHAKMRNIIENPWDYHIRP